MCLISRLHLIRQVTWAIGTDDDYVLNITRQQLAHGLSGLDIHATMRIARASDAEQPPFGTLPACGLVITGVACHKVFGRLRWDQL